MSFDVSSGTSLGKYRIVCRIGQGGMADVYEAEDTELRRRVALKLLPPEFARDPERVARFMKEVRNSASLQHPGIVPVYDVGEGDGYHFYTMQLLTGGDLKQRIQAGMTSDEALSVLAQVASALGAAHAKGVVHRDVKPENVMFDDGGRAILTDLGIAKAASGGTRMTKTGMSIGTPHYMSPEQARGRNVDGRSDIYSLGILFYEMLMGKVPYEAEESFAVGLMHINDPVPVLSSSLGRYQGLLNGMMAKNPEQRFDSCAVLLGKVRQVAQGENISGAAGAELPKEAPATAKTQVVASAETEGMSLEALDGRGEGGGDAGTSSTGKKLAAVVGGLVIAFAVFAVFTNGQSRHRPASGGGGGSVAAKTSPYTATISIKTVPAGASVYIDSEYFGRTPVKRKKLPTGRHELEVVSIGYETFTDVVYASSGKKIDRVIRLVKEKKSNRPSLKVTTEPANATVKIMNITPRYHDGIEVDPGKYTIRVEHPGYKTRERVVMVEKSLKNVFFRLEKGKDVDAGWSSGGARFSYNAAQSGRYTSVHSSESLALAVKNANAGDVLVLHPGTYEVQGTLRIRKPVTLVGESPKTTKIKIVNGFCDVDSSGVVFSGLHIKLFKSKRNCTVLVDNSGSLEIKYCKVTNANYAGVEVRKNGFALIQNSTLSWNTQTGLYVHDGARVDAKNVQFSNNGLDGAAIAKKASATLRECLAINNKQFGFRAYDGGSLVCVGCDAYGNRENFKKDSKSSLDRAS